MFCASRSLSENRRLLQLNLGGCSGFSAAAVAHMLDSCSRSASVCSVSLSSSGLPVSPVPVPSPSPLCSIQQLNISWCSFDSRHVKSVVDHLSSSVTHLNLSGYRENLTLEGKTAPGPGPGPLIHWWFRELTQETSVVDVINAAAASRLSYSCAYYWMLSACWSSTLQNV